MNETVVAHQSTEANRAISTFTREVEAAAHESGNQTRFKLTVLKEFIEQDRPGWRVHPVPWLDSRPTRARRRRRSTAIHEAHRRPDPTEASPGSTGMRHRSPRREPFGTDPAPDCRTARLRSRHPRVASPLPTSNAAPAIRCGGFCSCDFCAVMIYYSQINASDCLGHAAF